MNTEHVENVRDTQYENGFTVVRDYYARISYGQLLSCIIWTRKKQWDWVIWQNSKGVMLSQREGENGLFEYDETLNAILKSIW